MNVLTRFLSKNDEYTVTAAALSVFLCLAVGAIGVPAVVQAVSSGDASAYQGPRFDGNKPQDALRAAKRLERAMQYASNKAQPAVVTIFVQKQVEVQRRGFPFEFGPGGPIPFGREGPDRERRVRGLGSGLIIRSDGYILTNYHVVKDVDEVNVLLHGQTRVPAEVVGTDPRTDLAVLKVNRTELPTLDFADSNRVHVGDWAIAVGSPFSLRNSVSYGHVSALNRTVRATEYGNYIQTDAPINQGNSGGPLVNIEGEVIGINTLIQSTSGGSQGIGFAIASNLAQRVAQDLIQHGEVKRPWIGVAIQRLSPDALEEHFNADHGVVVSKVVDDSPAARAGIKQGDLILSAGGEAIESPHQLQQTVIQRDIGARVRFVVKRDGETRQITVKLGERPDPGKASTEDSSGASKGILEDLGLAVSRLTPKEARSMGLQLERSVLRIRAVVKGSVAHREGLRPNDLILSVDRTPIREPGEFQSYLEKQRDRGASSALLLVQRGEQSFYVTLPISGGE